MFGDICQIFAIVPSKVHTYYYTYFCMGSNHDINGEYKHDPVKTISGVLGVDDLHIWSIRTGYNALSGHIIIDKEDLMQCRKIVETVKASLKKQHNIQHATIEVELQDCTTHEGHEKH